MNVTSENLSYSRKDSVFAVWLRDQLEGAGFEVLRDLDDTVPGEVWWKRLVELIAAADSVVFVLSRNSVASKICGDEVRQALSLSKRIFPAVIADVDWARVPEGLSNLHSVFFKRKDEREASLRQLVTALLTDIDWVRQHTRLMERADLWHSKQRPKSELLAGRGLEEAEQWLTRQPKSAEPPTRLHREFIKTSCDAAKRSRNILTASLAAGLIMALGLAGVAYWQRGIAINKENEAVAQRARAEMNEREAQLARAEAERQRDEALRSESVALGSQSSSALASGQIDLAFQLASKGLPRLWRQSDRRVTDFALGAFFRAQAALVGQKDNVSVRLPHDGFNLTAIKISRDGKYVATAGWDATARIWDSSTLQNIANMRWHFGSAGERECRIVTSVDISPNSTLVATANLDGKVRLWKLHDGELVRELAAATDGAQCSKSTGLLDCLILKQVNK